MFPGPLKNHNPLLVENGVTFAFGLYICSHEFWVILSLFKLSCITQLLCDIMHMVRSKCLGNTNKKIICAYSIWTFFPVTLELLLVDLWIWDCPVVVLCLFGGGGFLSGSSHLQTEALEMKPHLHWRAHGLVDLGWLEHCDCGVVECCGSQTKVLLGYF